MPRDDSLNIRAMTSGEFVDAALTLGAGRTEALQSYRACFRTGSPLLLPGCTLHTPEMPVITSRTEHGTCKFIQRMDDGLETETVILQQRGSTWRRRTTLCLSSQVGCAMGCRFCETAQMGRLRQLTTDQIVAQWHAARHDLHTAIDNIVFMGMGEPMDNIEVVIQAIRVLSDRNAAAISPARISVSTAGHVKGMARLGDLVREHGFHQVRLAVSLNAPNDEIRSSLMPINRSAPMSRLMEVMRAWPGSARCPIMIEYVLIPGVNDAVEHANEICRYLEPLHCILNLIPYNPRRHSPWNAPSETAIQAFQAAAAGTGQLVRRRRTMGREIQGACGQLGNQGAPAEDAIARQSPAPTGSSRSLPIACGSVTPGMESEPCLHSAPERPACSRSSNTTSPSSMDSSSSIPSSQARRSSSITCN